MRAIRRIHPERSAFLVLLFVTSLGGALRVVNLGAKSFWIDELLSLCHAENIQTLQSLFEAACGNAHPPLYFLLLRVWRIYGDGESYLRLLSVAFGIAAIPTTYLLGRELSRKSTGLIAAGFVAISPFLLLYDRELRMYSALTFLTTCSVYCFLKAVREGRLLYWVLYTALSGVSVYVHYNTFLVLLFEWIFFLVVCRGRRELWVKAIVSQATLAIAFAAWLPVLLLQLRNPHLFTLDAPDKFPVTVGGWGAKLLYLFYALSFGQTLMPWRATAVIGMLAFAGVATVGFLRFRRDRVASIFAGLYLGVPILAGFYIYQSMPRYYVFLAPVYFVVLGEGILAFANSRWWIVITGLMLFPIVVSVANYYGNRDFHILATVDPWREVGQYVERGVRSGDCIVAIGSFRPLGYYTGNFAGFSRPIYGTDFREVTDCLSGGRGRQVWLVGADPALEEMTEEARRWLDEHYVRLSERKFYQDPNYLMKRRLFRKRFLEYRISVYSYRQK